MVLAYMLHIMQTMIQLAGQTSRAGGQIYFFIPFTPTTPGIAAGLSEFWKVVEVVFQLFWWLISIYPTIPSRTTSMTAARNPTRRFP